MPEVTRPDRTIYSEAVRQALVILWEAVDRIRGKRLKAILPRSSRSWSGMVISRLIRKSVNSSGMPVRRLSTDCSHRSEAG